MAFILTHKDYKEFLVGWHNEGRSKLLPMEMLFPPHHFDTLLLLQLLQLQPEMRSSP